MTAATTIVYLSVSTLSFIVQSVSLVRIVTRPGAIGMARHGLIRTAACRVIASSTYVGLGIAALFREPSTTTAAFVALVIIQLLWQMNAIADLRLSKQLSGATLRSKHKHEMRGNVGRRPTAG